MTENRIISAARVPLLALLASSSCLLFMLAMPLASAQAARVRPLLLAETLPELGTPLAVAIDQSTRHIYVGDLYQGTILNFEANGQLDAARPELVGAPPTFHAFKVAVDNSGGPYDGYVYAMDLSSESPERISASVRQFDPGGEATSVVITKASIPANGTPQGGGLAPVVKRAEWQPRSLSIGPSGDIYVFDAEQGQAVPEQTFHIDKFTPEGAFMAQLPSGEVDSSISDIAVDDTGHIYLASEGQGTPRSEGGLIELSAATGECLRASCAPIDPAPIYSVAVDESTQTVLTVGQSSPEDTEGKEGKISEYDATTGALLGSTHPAQLHAPHGIGILEATGELFVSNGRFPRESDDSLQIYGPAEEVPDVRTLAPESVTDGEATLRGEIGAAGIDGATCEFEYVGAAEFEAHGYEGAIKVPCDEGPFSGTALHEVAVDVEGLAGGTAFVYRLVGINQNGSNGGEAEAFKTLGPNISSPEATKVTVNGSELTALVDPRGLAGSYRMQYLTQAGYEAAGWSAATELPGSLSLVAQGVGDLEAGPSAGATGSLSTGASASGTGKLTEGSEEVTALVATEGSFQKGQRITGEGIPPGTVIEEVESGMLTLSHAATASVVTAALTAGSRVVALGTAEGFFEVGMPISGQGIATGTTVAEVDSEALVLSTPPVVAGNGVALAAGSRVVTSLDAQEGAFAPGQTIAGPGIPVDAKVIAVSPDGTEIGLSAAAGQTFPAAALTATLPQAVSQVLQGLSAGTEYRFRILASTGGGLAAGMTIGEAVTFSTFSSPLGGLPDSRRYEQATPTDKNGANAQGGIDSVQAALNGDGITFFANTGIPGGEGSQEFPTYLSTRSADGWSTQGLLPPASEGPRGHVIGWTEELTETFDFASQIHQPGKLLSRSSAGGSLTEIGELSTARNPFAFAGTSEDGAVALLESSNGGLVPGDLVGKQNVYVYDSEAHKLEVAGVLNPTTPGGEPVVPPGGAMAGSYAWFTGAGTSAAGGASGLYFTQAQHAISASGNRVFFTAGGTGQLYVRENPSAPQSAMSGERCTEASKACTVRISAPEEGVVDPETPVAFVGASSDGRLVYFLDRGKLTHDATGGSGYDLYRFDLQNEVLTDMTLDSTEKFGARVQGVLGMSNSGGSAYFVAAGSLNSEAVAAPDGETNLYALDGGEIHFITRLISNNKADGEQELRNWVPTAKYGNDGGFLEYVAHTSRVSADGKTLLFRSARQLTSYRNHGVEEMYLYRTGDGIDCVSCNPTGEAPVGPAGVQQIPVVGLQLVRSYAFMTRNLSAGGRRVIFDSADRLVPGDENTVNDVYEWEEPGEGTCAESSSAYSPQDAGCIFLISGGAKGAGPSWFGDASPDGKDIFFFTAQSLVPQDRDELVDIYDARVGGGLASQEVVKQEPCESEGGCLPKQTAQPQAASPGSLSASGSNVNVAKPKPCKAGQVRKRGKCVARPKKHKGKKKHGHAAGKKEGKKKRTGKDENGGGR